MLGYVLALPVDCAIARIDAAIQGEYDLDAALKEQPPHQHSLAIFENAIDRYGEDQIGLIHFFVDMSPRQSFSEAVQRTVGHGRTGDG